MSQPSGKFVLRLDPRLHDQLRRAAERRGVSLNQFCSAELGQAVAGVPVEQDRLAFGLPVARLRKVVEDADLGLLGVVLFGSVGRGEATESSDIDLLLVFPPTTVPTREHYTLWDEKVVPALARVAPGKFSPQFVALPSDPADAGGIWFEVALEGILLWEESAQIAAFLSKLRAKMADGEIVRRVSHGHPFWIRKPT